MSTELIEQPDLFSDWVKPREDGMGAEVHPDISYEHWSQSVQACGSAWRSLGKQQDILEFVLADLYLAGEKYFPDQFSQMMDNCVIDYKRLTRILWVAKEIPADKRHSELSFSHHEVVAGVKDSLQRDELLTEAETEKLTVSDLTKLRKAKCPTQRDTKPKKASQKAQDAPQSDPKDEHTLIEHGREIIAYLEAEEKELPFREWPKNRLKAWAPILATLTKIARRSIIKTH